MFGFWVLFNHFCLQVLLFNISYRIVGVYLLPEATLDIIRAWVSETNKRVGHGRPGNEWFIDKWALVL